MCALRVPSLIRLVAQAALNVYTNILARKVPWLRVNACTPGFIATDLTAGMGASNPPEKVWRRPVPPTLDPRPRSLSSSSFLPPAAR